MKLKRLVVAIGCLFLAGTAFAEPVEEPSESQELEIALSPPEKCVSLARINSTRVISDQTVLFYMKGGKVYRNDLPHKCSGLRMNDSFMYRTSLGELCDIDTITVLMRMGSSLTPGISCGLGRFQPIPEGEARVLVEEIRHKR